MLNNFKAFFCKFASECILLTFDSIFCGMYLNRLKYSWCVAMLIAVLSFNIGCLYVPHHHHEGRICVENSKDSTSHDNHSDEGHIEQIDIEMQRSAEDGNHFASLVTILPLIYNGLFGCGADTPVRIGSDEILNLSLLYFNSTSHKLRGSPLFS